MIRDVINNIVVGLRLRLELRVIYRMLNVHSTRRRAIKAFKSLPSFQKRRFMYKYAKGIIKLLSLQKDAFEKPLHPCWDYDYLFEMLFESHSLSLNNMGIKRLPNDLKNLKHLTSLNLRGNKISNIPSDFVSLSNLRRIDLSYNNIMLFPTVVLEYVDLSYLDLGNNNILHIPYAIRKLEKLEDFIV